MPSNRGLTTAFAAQIGVEVRNRLRSPATLVALLAILVGSYWAIPPADGRAVSLSWRDATGKLQAPLYTAGTIGIALSVTATLFFALVAFYLVAGAVRRDRERGIGAILAATPIGKSSYLGAKLVAHVLYLLLLVLAAVPVGFFHFWRSGVGPFDAGQFFRLFLLGILPAATFVAASALLFDVTPVLRSRAGLVLWFFLGVLPLMAVPTTLAAASGKRVTRLPAFDPLGLAVHEVVVQRSLPPGATDVSSGLIIHDQPMERVAWKGLDFPPGLAASRLRDLLWAAVPFLLAVVIFDRFDPARHGWRRRTKTAVNGEPVIAVAAVAGAAPLSSFAALAPVAVAPGATGAVLAEARLIWESAGRSKWVLLVAAIVAAVVPAAALPIVGSLFLLLLVPLVSETACREDLAGARPLVLSQPAVPSSLILWKFAALALVLLVLGLPLTVRGLVAGGLQGVAVPLGLLFVAAFAVGAGSLSRGGKLFSGIYLVLWYMALNGLAAVDFCGILAPHPDLTTRGIFLLAGALWLAGAGLVERRRSRAGA